MPVYNNEEYLGEAIDSIINQTFINFELLIVDDGSTDESANIIEDYKRKDRRVNSLINRYEKGIVGALNSGMENAKGIYFARADADDINRPYRLEKQYNFLEKNQDIYILGGGYAPFNENGHRDDIIRSSSSLEIAWRFVCDTYFCHPTVMFRKEIYDEFGSYPMEEAEDFSYFSNVIKKYKCSNLKEILIDYREHETSRSISVANKIAQSAKKTFNKNYYFYIGNKNYCDIFYNFQVNNRLKLRYFVKIFHINLLILKKIRNQYKMTFFHIENIILIIKIIQKIQSSLVSELIISSKSIIKKMIKGTA